MISFNDIQKGIGAFNNMLGNLDQYAYQNRIGQYAAPKVISNGADVNAYKSAVQSTQAPYQAMMENRQRDEVLAQRKADRDRQISMENERLRLEKEERDRIQRQREQMQQVLTNPEVLGNLSTNLGLPPELIAGAGIENLGTLGKIAEITAPPSELEQLSLQEARLRNQILEKQANGTVSPLDRINLEKAQLELEKARRDMQPKTGIGDLLNRQQSQNVPKEVGYQAPVQQAQPLTIDNQAVQAESELSEINELLDQAILTPDFDENELDKLEMLRDRTSEKLQIAQEKVNNRDTLLSQRNEIDNYLEDLKRAKELIGPETSGLGVIAPTRLAPGTATSGIEGWFAKASPTSRRSQLEQTLSRPKSGAAINVLSEAKSQSKTGATGFGALSEKELKVITDKVANLTVGQRDEDLMRNIEDLERYYGNIQSKIDKGLSQLGIDYPTAQSVRDDVLSGKLTEEQGEEILINQFGYE